MKQTLDYITDITNSAKELRKPAFKLFTVIIA